MNISKDDELMMEGLFTRSKARVAGAVGSAKGAVQTGKGIVRKVAGTAMGNSEMQAKGEQEIDAGQKAGDEAKKASITKSIIDGVVDDLAKLGLDGDPEVVDVIQKELNAIFDLYLVPPFPVD